MDFSNGSANCSCPFDKSDLDKLAADIQSTNSAGDVTWILMTAIMIFTMQSGFGLLEAGSVSPKNQCSVMIKNSMDLVCGGLSYWLLGFGFSFGDSHLSNPFCGVGDFITGAIYKNDANLYVKYFFQLSFATTATTIVSGGMSERVNLKAYMLYAFLSFFSYVFPAHWMWASNGFLKTMGVIDDAGCGAIHLVGGTAALVATVMLKPRHGRFSRARPRTLANPTNVVLGTFMLWWGWLAFNCGSSFGVRGNKWKMASIAAVTTINGSIGGGLFGIIYSKFLCKRFRGKLDISIFTSTILSGLVSITAINEVCLPHEALIIGFIGGIICCYGIKLLDMLKVDDPISCVPVHCLCGAWGLIATGIFAATEEGSGVQQLQGLYHSGGWKLLGVEILAVICLMVWSATVTFVLLFICDKAVGLRLSLENEIMGSDFYEHGIGRSDFSTETDEDLTYLEERIPEDVKQATSFFYPEQNLLRRTLSLRRIQNGSINSSVVCFFRDGSLYHLGQQNKIVELVEKSLNEIADGQSNGHTSNMNMDDADSLDEPLLTES